MDKRYQDIHIYFEKDYAITTFRMVEIKSISVEETTLKIIGLNGNTNKECIILVPKVKGIKLLID